MKVAINAIVFFAWVAYGVMLLAQSLGVFFVMGDNDTAPEVLGIIAYYLTPIPAVFLACRYRKMAALCFALAAALYIAGAVQNEMYLQAQSAQRMVPFDHQIDRIALTKSLATETAPFFATAAFLLITDLLKWPGLFAENRHKRDKNDLQ